ncbi:lasso RiPP family leader peptide-containing protein [Streptomyces sp. NRRL S-337]|uniref:lasso RiPP family leader peptide-containing protein n=1 Tax=Streptomyces sp. NRRL S-337 TaxID=1463900 RepID=UPI000AEA1EA7|nr:lasso RiPP family leader peptide-containing protein [Streptomyces sp. NRRL S-337]
MQDTHEVPTVPDITGTTATATDYEPPQLVEVGNFTELTLGYTGYHWDGWAGFFGW